MNGSARLKLVKRPTSNLEYKSVDVGSAPRWEVPGSLGIIKKLLL